MVVKENRAKTFFLSRNGGEGQGQGGGELLRQRRLKE